MHDDTDRLVERWILAFCETPALIDGPLMRLVLDEHDAKLGSLASSVEVVPQTA